MFKVKKYYVVIDGNVATGAGEASYAEQLASAKRLAKINAQSLVAKLPTAKEQKAVIVTWQLRDAETDEIENSGAVGPGTYWNGR